jgi:GNAT superfamily N-acetyltransferase
MRESGRGDSTSALEERLQVSVEYTVELPPFGADFFRELCGLCGAVFKEPVNDLRWRLENMPCPTVVCARASGRIVGFKAGYAMSQSRYCSWLGGVRPDSRRHGIASHLMELQHELVRKRGFEFIETAADEGNVAMSRANLKHGFAICGLRSKPDRVQVLFSKSLQ